MRYVLGAFLVLVAILLGLLLARGRRGSSTGGKGWVQIPVPDPAPVPADPLARDETPSGSTVLQGESAVPVMQVAGLAPEADLAPAAVNAAEMEAAETGPAGAPSAEGSAVPEAAVRNAGRHLAAAGADAAGAADALGALGGPDWAGRLDVGATLDPDLDADVEPEVVQAVDDGQSGDDVAGAGSAGTVTEAVHDAHAGGVDPSPAPELLPGDAGPDGPAVSTASSTAARHLTYLPHLQRYHDDVDLEVLRGVVRHCGIALRSRDASLVSAGDAQELARVREGFLKKKLALDHSDAELDAAIAAVMDQMAGDRAKSRVTVYYLLAHRFAKLDLFR